MISYASFPSPKELPILGSLHRRFGGGTLDFFREMGQLGPVVRFHLLNERFVLVNEPELVQEVLVTKQAFFHKGRALEKARHYLGNSLLVSEEAEHARQRKLLQPAFHRARITGYATTMAHEAERWVERRVAGEKIDMAREMNGLTLNIVAGTLFGSSVEKEAGGIAQAMTVVIENFNRMIMPFYSILSQLPTRQNRELNAAQDYLEQTIYHIIAARRKENQDRGDLLSMLLAAEDAESEHQRLSDQEVRDQALTLFLAGHETTANGLAWTWHLLAQNPAVGATMRQEVLTVLGKDRRPDLEDVAKLPYTLAIFNEAIRLYPPAWVIGRRAQQDVTLGDYEIPARTIVISSPYLLHHDARFWPAPEQFQPERWLEEDPQRDPQRPKFAYLPFGTGARVCIGESFAKTEAVLVLATLARKWKFSTAPEAKIALNPTLTLRPLHGLSMVVEPILTP